MNISEQIKNSLEISDIIGEKVRLKRAGRGYVGLCPFHDEKTGSFHVFSDTQSYYCFGCHEAGDIFTFVMKTEGLSYSEALSILASRAGIKLNNNNNNNNREKSLYEIMNMTAKFFTDNLTSSHGNAARAYMQRRNLSQNDIARFSLGYSLNSWDSLVKYLRNQGIKDKTMLDAGLALQGNHGLYDRFRGRLIFPVKDITGRIIAFGGRLIDGEGAKYINSPENEIYSKRKNLYLLHDARKAIKDKNRVILVEGYMDALRLHKCGYNETVASLGTSLTQEQAELLARFSSSCYICYDSDTAGQNATQKGMYILASNGLDVRVINIPDGKDPDEFLCTNKSESFEQAITNSVPLVLHQIKFLAPALCDPAKRKAATKELFDNLSKLNISDVAPYRSQICELTFIPPSELDNIIFGNNPNPSTPSITPITITTPTNSPDNLEAVLCAMLFNYAECRLKLNPEEVYKILQSEKARNTAISILTENTDNLASLWLSTGDIDKISLIKRGEELYKSLDKAEPMDTWQKIYNILKSQCIQKRINEIKLKMRQNLASPQELLELKNLIAFSPKL